MDQIFRRYSDLHPNLLPSEYKHGVKVYENEANVFEVFAYYKGEQTISVADEGTKLRFVEPVNSKSGLHGRCKLPGIISLPAEFHSCHPAYFDHWVSNGKSSTNVLYLVVSIVYEWHYDLTLFSLLIISRQ